MNPLGIIAGLATAGINAASQNNREQRAMRNQRELMDLQQQNQQQLNEQGANLQYQNWLRTNYSAQVKQMEKAGLNVGLMYGMSGAGGATTGSQGGGSAASGNAPAPQQMDIGNIMQAASQVAAQTELLKAQKENIEADTRNKEAQEGATKQSTETEKFNTILKELETLIQRPRSKHAQDMADSEALKKDEEWRKLEWENRFSRESFNEKLRKLEAEATNEETKKAILKAESEIKEFEAKLTRDGIHPNSPWYVKLLTDMIQESGLMRLIKGK